jgi:hypothetical protein
MSLKKKKEKKANLDVPRPGFNLILKNETGIFFCQSTKNSNYNNKNQIW